MRRPNLFAGTLLLALAVIVGTMEARTLRPTGTMLPAESRAYRPLLEAARGQHWCAACEMRPAVDEH